LSARLRLGSEVVTVTFRRRDIYAIGEILHERPYRLERRLPPAPVILDSGANIGMATLWFRASYPAAEVHCFEPESENFDLLRRNVAGLPRSHCVHAALGATEGQVRLAMSDGPMSSRISADPAAPGDGTEVVPCTTGAAYLERMGIERVDLLKLDVEGHEIEVVRGFAPLLPRVQGIVGEVHERLIDQAEFYSLLEDSGFSIVARRETRNSTRAGVHMFEAVRHR
jgi:FkbM family methyltransferase